MVAQSQFGAETLQRVDLLETVVNYKATFYPQPSARYDLAKDPRTLVLVPPNQIRAELERDYARMIDEMIYPGSNPPSLNELESELGRIQTLVRKNGKI